MQAPLIDITMLRVDTSGDAAGDETEHDRVRARRVVEYVRQHVPAMRDDDARADPDDDARCHDSNAGGVVI
jgi:hypothetical protein